MAAATGRVCYKRLLQAARGGATSNLRCFPLQAQHFRLESIRYSPREFGNALCKSIRNAQHRVHLASLYIGPAADPVVSPQEVELLDALAQTTCPDVCILLDQSRALRPVPLSKKNNKSFITSAQACHQALQQRKHPTRLNASVYLLTVLPEWLWPILPNPYNEVAGVFHIKLYIVDDNLILTGANLSQEYFSDRMDRYLWIQNGGAGLVDCYDDLFMALSQHAVRYDPTHERRQPSRTTRAQLVDDLTDILTVQNNKSSIDELQLEKDFTRNSSDDFDILAYAVPTWQAPAYWPSNNRLPMDVQVIENLLVETQQHSTDLRLASAYLNPTFNFEGLRKTHLLTAGRMSHGFKPKPKSSGNKGKEWIPTVYDKLARQAQAQLWFYQRKAWTFHAKGMWLTSGNGESSISDSSLPLIPDNSSLLAVTHGSSNYGARSTFLDLESNLILIFPNKASPVQQAFVEEWNRFCQYAKPAHQEEPQALPWHLQIMLPWIKTFF